MKKGFTLLELIIVIVILGVMATLATTQYSRMVEKSRGAEARTALGAIRTNEAAMRLQNGSCSSVAADAGISTDFPSACTGTHYFSYGLTAASGNTFTAVATRCTTSGKSPTGSGSITLTTDFGTGSDAWAIGAGSAY
jgi:prepilin-type N-terminal cleavage/methylation domain-containing protein